MPKERRRRPKVRIMDKIKQSRISVIVPTFNEKENILLLIDEIHSELSGFTHEILVVDDNSPDGTYQLVCAQKYDFVKPILRTQNRGLAASIRCGLEQATGDIFVVMDSDFNHQPKYIPQMLKNLEFYDAVIGSRFLYGGAMDSRARHILSWVFNIFIRFISTKHITDSLYGFYAIHRSVMSKVNYDKIFWGYGDYCIRLMYYLQELDSTILQIPVVNRRRSRGQANTRFLKTFFQYTAETFKLFFRERIGSRWLK